MKEKQVTFDRIEIDDCRIDSACSAYFKWKDLNTYVKNNATRGLNMPDVISEPMACYCFGLLWNRGKAVGDATDKETFSKIEIKATSKFDGDLSSFGPKCYFDNLIFLRYNLDDNEVWMYDLKINSDEFGKIKINKTETVQDQKDAKRRPHLSLVRNLIEPNNIKPDLIFDIRRIKIIKDERTK